MLKGGNVAFELLSPSLSFPGLPIFNQGQVRMTLTLFSQCLLIQEEATALVLEFITWGGQLRVFWKP